jgi:hypothetical protein
MKITYEFDTADDDYDVGEHLMFQNARKMYTALFEISGILREYRKGWAEENFDELDSRILEELSESGYDEIP